MMLSLPRKFSLFNGLPQRPLRLNEPVETAHPQSPMAPRPVESPGFLPAGFAPYEPDPTQEFRQAPGEQAARRAGAEP